MTVIYRPKGRALEYSPLACNLYIGCTHGCKYCYAPGCMRKTAAEWQEDVYARKGVLRSFEKDCEALKKARSADDKHRVLFCFLSDPYQPLERDLHVTRCAISIAMRYGVKISVLTKGSYDTVEPDLSLMKSAGVHLGITLSFVTDSKRKVWEPNASTVMERFKLLRKAHDMGIYTWVSMEPVIDDKEALRVIDRAHEIVDFWKVGKLNHNREQEHKIDWHKFYIDVKAKLDGYGSRYYIKQDLRAFAKMTEGKTYDSERRNDNGR